MAAGLGLLLGLALALDAVSAEAGARAEVHGRRFDEAGQPARAVASVEATPWVALVLRQPDLRGRIDYAPRLSWPELGGEPGPDLVHQLRLEARQRLDPSVQLGASAAGAYGSSRPVDEARRLRAADEPSPEPVVTTGTIRSLHAQVALRMDWRAGARAGAGGSVTWSRSGGADTASRAVMPPEQSLRLDASGLWRASRVDDLGLEAVVSDTRFDQGGGAAFALASATWRRRLLPSLTAWARGGAGASSTEPAGQEAVRRPVFGGELGVAHAQARPGLAGQLVLRASPVVDRLLGTVDSRLEAELSGATPFPGGWRLAARATGAIVRRTAGDARLLLFDLRVDRPLGQQASVSAGAYATRQVTQVPDLPSFFEGGLRVGVEWWSTARPGRGAQ